MLSQIHMAKSAMFAFQRKLQVIINNISNAQTVAFKKRRCEMESLFPLILRESLQDAEDVPGAASGERKKYVEYGQGVRVVDIRKHFELGTIEITNQPLDMSIEGQGFFQFRIADGTLAYSRAGNLHQDREGNVVNPNGQPLEPPLRIPQNTTDIIINEEGRVFAQTNAQPIPREIGQITLANFVNPGGLKDSGQNLYKETVSSGPATLERPGTNSVGNLRQRTLEYSNVNVIEEMMAMLLTQRAYEVVIKSINTGDSMLKSGSDIGK